MSKDFKPMLAVNADKEKIKYPCYASNKLDGIRCIFKDGQMLARSLKPITSETLQKRFQWLKDLTTELGIIFDGELYCHGMPFTEISHFVRKTDIEVPVDIKFHCFDIILNDLYNEPFTFRIDRFAEIALEDSVELVMQREINNEKELDDEFARVLESGYEGLILRSTEGPYKFGRSSVTEGYLLKVKPFLSWDTKVIDVIERNENLNESFKNELGRSTKRNTKLDKKGTGIAACLVTKYKGIEMRVTLTGNEDFRKEIWENKENYIGKMFEWKGMEIGMKDVPRHPNFKRWRKDKDE